MQTQSWTNKALQDDFGECSSLKSIIGKLEAKLWEHGEVICEIHVNGYFLDESDEQRLAESKLGDIENLRVLSRRPDELVEESVKSVCTLIPKVIASCETLSFAIRDQGEITNQAPLVEIIDGCHWLSETLVHIKQILLGEDAEEAVVKSWATNEQSLKAAIIEIVTTYEAKDHSTLADVLEYTLSQSLDDWLALIKVVRP